jgi:hypothetical protein
MAHADHNAGRPYVGRGVPHSVRDVHDHVQHGTDTPVGEKGLRAWTQRRVPPRDWTRQNRNLGRGFPGKNAYVIWEFGRESRLSRHLRRVARERAIRHRRQWHVAWARVRELLAHRKAED